MPVVKARLSRLFKLIGTHNADLLQDVLFNLKSESEIEGEEISIEVQSDRVDMFSVEGIANAVKLYLEIAKPSLMTIESTDFKVYVDAPSKRPYIAIAAVKNVNLNDELLKDLIEFQERLHATFGRNRRRVAIGLHDLDKLPSKTICYRDVDIDQTYMVPLHDYRRMSVGDVLKTTEQGMLYGSISINNNMHPAILSGNEVISLPPVINSSVTQLEPSTESILIDVTGTDMNAVKVVLNTIIHALTLYSGSIIAAEIVYPNHTVITPDLTWRKMNIDVEFISTWLGLERGYVSSKSPAALAKMGYIVNSVSDRQIEVLVPYYRSDILHQVDVVEDIAIGMGYSSIVPEPVVPVGTGRGKEIDRIITAVLREVLVGLGYVETNTLTMLPSKFLELMGVGDSLRIENPPSMEMDALRNALLQSMLILLTNAQHLALPVKLFEIGDVVSKCEECYNKWSNEQRVAWVIMDSEIKFEDIHADLYVVLRELMLNGMMTIKRCSRPLFINGRCGCIEMDGEVIGVMGELDPEILLKVGIEYPVAGVELSVSKLVTNLGSRKS